MAITIQGVDAVPWFYRPDGRVLERLEWKTDVLPSFNGREQRRGLRLSPRRTFELGFVLSAAERRQAENRMTQAQAQLLALPVWMDAQPLPAALSIGNTTAAIDTTTRDYRIGSYVGFATSSATFETALISAVASGLLTFGALTANWPAGSTVVFPVRGVRMDAELGLQRFTGDTSYGRARFECTEPNDYAAASETNYRSIPVLNSAPNWDEDIDFTFRRHLQRVDGAVGLSFFDDETGGPEFIQSHRWLLDGRTAIDGFRQWLYARRGRLQQFWLPTFAQDFNVTATINSAATTIDVEHANYVADVAQAIGRRDIRIELLNGTTYHRRISGSTVVNPTTERLTIDAALGATVTTAELKAVSFMALNRLETDGVEIAWSRFDLAESRLLTRSSRNDL